MKIICVVLVTCCAWGLETNADGKLGSDGALGAPISVVRRKPGANKPKASPLKTEAEKEQREKNLVRNYGSREKALYELIKSDTPNLEDIDILLRPKSLVTLNLKMAFKGKDAQGKNVMETPYELAVRLGKTNISKKINDKIVLLTRIKERERQNGPIGNY